MAEIPYPIKPRTLPRNFEVRGIVSFRTHGYSQALEALPLGRCGYWLSCMPTLRIVVITGHPIISGTSHEDDVCIQSSVNEVISLANWSMGASCQHYIISFRPIRVGRQTANYSHVYEPNYGFIGSVLLTPSLVTSLLAVRQNLIIEVVIELASVAVGLLMSFPSIFKASLYGK